MKAVINYVKKKTKFDLKILTESNILEIKYCVMSYDNIVSNCLKINRTINSWVSACVLFFLQIIHEKHLIPGFYLSSLQCIFLPPF